MYDFLETAVRMLATPSVTTEGTADLVEYLLASVVPYLPGEAEALAEPDGRNVNLLVAIPGTSDLSPLLLNAHLDTVAAGEPRRWTSTRGNPFRPRLDGDRLIGLGSADAKLDWLCKAEAVRRAAQGGLKRPLYLLATFGEEMGLLGARRFLERGMRVRPAAALVGEPTECKLVTKHKGLLVGRLVLTARSRKLARVVLDSRTRRYVGRSAHSATPDEGENAILKALSTLADETPVVAIRGGDAANKVPASCEVDMAVTRRRRRSDAAPIVARPQEVRPMSPALLTAARDFVGALLALAETYGTEDGSFSPPHPTANIGFIDGRGARLTMTFDLRSLPKTDGAGIRTKLMAVAKEIEGMYAGVRAEIEIERDNAPLPQAPARLVNRALAVMASVGLRPDTMTKAGCTEAGLYASAGIPSVVFGAGRASGNIHAPNEWTSVTQLRQAVNFYAAFIERYCRRA